MFYSIMKDDKDSIVGGTELDVVSNNESRLESHAVSSHGILEM